MERTDRDLNAPARESGFPARYLCVPLQLIEGEQDKSNPALGDEALEPRRPGAIIRRQS